MNKVKVLIKDLHACPELELIFALGVIEKELNARKNQVSKK